MVEKEPNETGIGLCKFNDSIQDQKESATKKVAKTYKVTITYIHLTEEEAKSKRAIVESIIKKSYKQKHS